MDILITIIICYLCAGIFILALSMVNDKESWKKEIDETYCLAGKIGGTFVIILGLLATICFWPGAISIKDS